MSDNNRDKASVNYRHLTVGQSLAECCKITSEQTNLQ